jgi:hypothetical protein
VTLAARIQGDVFREGARYKRIPMGRVSTVNLVQLNHKQRSLGEEQSDEQ